jgi:hypothetical protein
LHADPLILRDLKGCAVADVAPGNYPENEKIKEVEREGRIFYAARIGARCKGRRFNCIGGLFSS